MSIKYVLGIILRNQHVLTSILMFNLKNHIGFIEWFKRSRGRKWHILDEEQLLQVGFKGQKGFYRICRGSGGHLNKGSHMGNGQEA